MGNTHLHRASKNHDIQHITSILEKEGRKLVNNKNSDGFTPLMLACFFGKDEIEPLRILIKYGADIDMRNTVKKKIISLFPISHFFLSVR